MPARPAAPAPASSASSRRRPASPASSSVGRAAPGGGAPPGPSDGPPSGGSDTVPVDPGGADAGGVPSGRGVAPAAGRRGAGSCWRTAGAGRVTRSSQSVVGTGPVRGDSGRAPPGPGAAGLGAAGRVGPPVLRSRARRDGRAAGCGRGWSVTLPRSSRRSISRGGALTALPCDRAFSWRRRAAAALPDRPDVFTPAAASAQSRQNVRDRASTLQSGHTASSHRTHVATARSKGCRAHDGTGRPFPLWKSPAERRPVLLHRPTTLCG